MIKTKKHSFTLLEITIAIAIVTLSFGFLFSSTTRSLRHKLRVLEKIECERLAELSFFETLDAWIKNEHVSLPSTQETAIKRLVKLTTRSKISKQNEAWQKVKIHVKYPHAKVAMDYFFLVKSVDKKIE